MREIGRRELRRDRATRGLEAVETVEDASSERFNAFAANVTEPGSRRTSHRMAWERERLSDSGESLAWKFCAGCSDFIKYSPRRDSPTNRPPARPCARLAITDATFDRQFLGRDCAIARGRVVFVRRGSARHA